MNNDNYMVPVTATVTTNDETTKSTLTGESATAIRDIASDEDMLIALTAIYDNGIYIEPDLHETDKIRKITREYLFPGLKFCLGEGRPNNAKYVLSDKELFGKCHERPDLTKKNYANKVKTSCGIDVAPTLTNIKERAQWWKTYNRIILLEIRRKRSQMNTKIKTTIYQGKKALNNMIILMM